MKVISFCLWGNKPQYVQGALKNLQLAKEIYPDWTCLFFMNEDEYWHYDRGFKDAVYEAGAYFHIFSRYKDHHLMLARFLAINIKMSKWTDIDVMLSRDCDSRLSLREKLAVDKWMASDKQFLVMKDHPWHAGVPVLGGLWGVKAGLLPNMTQMVNDFIEEDPRNEWQCDQRFLTNKIWPKVAHTAMIFDPFYGGLNYPIPREGFKFCGATHDENDKIPQEQIDLLSKYWRD